MGTRVFLDTLDFLLQVRGGVSSQREVGRHHVRPLRHRDSARDWDQQSASQTKAQARYTGNS